MTIQAEAAHTAGGDLATQDAYFSVDVETDGPIPGDYSLLAFAVVAAGTHDGKKYVSPEDWQSSRYWELKPTGRKFEREAIAVNKLDRNALLTRGLEPKVAMRDAYEWIVHEAAGRRPVMVASPAGFDWMFLHWYFIHFMGKSPFGHSALFDIKTALAVKLDRPIAMSGRESVPRWLGSRYPHSHNALDDAREQAEIFTNLMEWRGLSASSPF